jgi:transposase
MPAHTISHNLKDRIPILFHQGYAIKDICDILGIRKSAAYQALQYFRDFGRSTNPYTQQAGCPRSLDPTDNDYIKAILDNKHCLYLDEIQDKLAVQQGVHISLPTLCRTLRRFLLTNKRILARALERNDIHRSAFMNKIADDVPDANMLMFINEAAKNERTSGRMNGWALVGHRCVQ